MVLIGDFSLQVDSAHVWVFKQTPQTNIFNKSQKLLNTHEIHRANKYISKIARDKFLFRRMMVRQLLSLYTNQAPCSIRFNYGEYGKPSLPQSSIFFNVSHSEDVAIIAISTLEMGADVEAVRAIDDLELVAKHHFSNPEQEALLSTDDDARVQAFYRCWTRKEAFIKLIGTGLYTPLDSFAVTLLEDETPQIRFLTLQSHSDCFLYSFEFENRYLGALATHTPIQEIIIHNLR